ncbi:hypothetical protein EVAR_35563_1 [Eumeta japonica]|uniref:Uncharacterized protein n=1 Tax=Eumeta variegata TaxID=151549 RepID=A0A4C1XNM4_EUMVA|nr:hypothetical protein EVAR_35563_1 [Eumeta japonica]
MERTRNGGGRQQAYQNRNKTFCDRSDTRFLYSNKTLATNSCTNNLLAAAAGWVGASTADQTVSGAIPITGESTLTRFLSLSEVESHETARPAPRAVKPSVTDRTGAVGRVGRSSIRLDAT